MQGKLVGSFPVHRLLLECPALESLCPAWSSAALAFDALQGSTSHSRARGNRETGKPFSTPG